MEILESARHKYLGTHVEREGDATLEGISILNGNWNSIELQIVQKI